MDPSLKKILKAVTLEFRHLLEGKYDSSGGWQPGDLEDRLSSIGVWRDRDPIPADELGHLSEQDKQARTAVDAYLGLRREAGIAREEAVAEYRRQQPDLVTLDIVMPKRNGVQALQQIIEFDPRAQVVMVSAVNQKDKLAECIRCGAIDFIVKPFDATELRAFFVKQLDLDRASKE